MDGYQQQAVLESSGVSGDLSSLLDKLYNDKNRCWRQRWYRRGIRYAMKEGNLSPEAACKILIDDIEKRAAAAPSVPERNGVDEKDIVERYALTPFDIELCEYADIAGKIYRDVQLASAGVVCAARTPSTPTSRAARRMFLRTIITDAETAKIVLTF